MRRAIVGLTGCGAVLAVVVVLAASASGSARPGAAQGDQAAATATRAAEEAELAELRTQVAELSTEVAQPGGEEPLAGRLGGPGASFDAAYGAPTAFVGADQVGYDVEGVGRLTVTFVDDRAHRLVVSPARPPAKPSTEPDPADWTLAEALDVARRFAPADAELGDDLLDRAAGDAPATATSGALAGEGAADGAGACLPAPVSFTVDVTTPTPETVSAVTLNAAVEGQVEAEATPAVETVEVPEEGGTVARSSLPGVVTVNGIRIEAIQVDVDAAGTEPAAGGREVAIELELENRSDAAYRFEPTDFLLVDEGTQGLTAGCGHVEPAIAAGELPPGESVTGWVTFQLPADFEPERFVHLIGGSTSTRIEFFLE